MDVAEIMATVLLITSAGIGGGWSGGYIWRKYADTLTQGSLSQVTWLLVGISLVVFSIVTAIALVVIVRVYPPRGWLLNMAPVIGLFFGIYTIYRALTPSRKP